MQGGWRAERRNRNAGQPWAGRSRHGRMDIPGRWQWRGDLLLAFYERLQAPVVQDVSIAGRTVAMVWEAPREGSTYGCSPADAAAMLRLAAPFAARLPDIVAFRQPTRKQEGLQPVWGRLVYQADIAGREGSAIVLEAQSLGKTLRWSRRLDPEDQAELSRLRADGHVFAEDRRGFAAALSEETVRATILYRTLLHELGHWDDYVRKVDAPQARDRDANENASDLYFARPQAEREAYAHRFADETSAALRAAGTIPFEPLPWSPETDRPVSPGPEQAPA